MKLLRNIQRLCKETPTDNYTSGFSYYAFISYNEKDEKWAKWLQWKLEHYRIPTKARNEHNDIPKRIRPVFWYKNDLAGAHLNGSIQKELKRSQYMIVICSRNSAQSDWVNDEVSFFKDELGRGDKIIPFVVDGDINSTDPHKECLPLAIRHLPRTKELRCVDVREYGRSKALVNIVSTLFDIRFNILWNRFKFEQIRLLAVCSILAIILFCCWDYFYNTKYQYYVDVEDCNGIPTGILRVNNKDARNRYRLYRFEYRSQMLQRVVYVDGKGNPQNHDNTEYAERPCIQELLYDSGSLSRVICKNATNETLYIMHFSKDKLSVDLKDEDEDQAANFIFSSTAADQGQLGIQTISFLDKFLKSSSKIGRYVYERDDDGYIIRKMFARNNGDDDEIGIDANGISGFEYERDSLHRVEKISFLDMHGEYRANNMGVACKKYQYNEGGNLVVAEYLDEKGLLKYNELHWAKAIDKYDDNGFITEESYYGTDGNPCTSINGSHRISLSYSEDAITIHYFDINDFPTYTLPYANVPGGYAAITYVIDDKGQIIEARYLDSDGNSTYNNQHVATNTIEYNDMGLVVGIRCFDTDGNPCSDVNGYHYMCNEYNNNGCLTEQSLYNVEELPTNNALGIHCMNFHYDNTGRRVSEVHLYNSSKLPISNPFLGGAAWVRLGYHGSSTMASDIFFYSVDNEPMEVEVGSRVSCERNSYGQITSYRYYDTDNMLYSNSEHCAIMELSYNNSGMETERCYYDEDKRPMSVKGIFRISISYTKYGQVEKVSFYDTLQRPVVCPDGWSIQQNKYQNNVICETSYYGNNEEPVEVNGVHRYLIDVDECGKILSQTCFNKNNEPTLNYQSSAHKVEFIYDDKGRVIGRDYYLPYDEEPFVSVRDKLNPKGQAISETAYNNNELVESQFVYGGAARIQCEFDEQDRPVHFCAYDRNDKKMNTYPYGYAEALYSYEKHIEEALFLDEDGKPVNNEANENCSAYIINYISDTGQPLFGKSLKLSYDGDIETRTDALLFDLQGQPVQIIRCEDDVIRVSDIPRYRMRTYYSFSDEYDKYIHVMDSVESEMKSKYGSPKLSFLLNE